MTPTSSFATLVAAALIIRNDKVLLLHRNGNWLMPGGRVEDGEDPAITALREAFEEVNLAGNAPLHIGHRVHPVKGYNIDYYLMEDCVGEAVNREPDKHDDMQWFDPAEALARMGVNAPAPVEALLRKRLSHGLVA